ncbi:hypothetical protein ALQ89_05616, partial [Pseudomonas amygdali pv. tabaci]
RSASQICAALHRQDRTRSVQNGMPTRSMGTMVILWTPIVPHALAWECLG